MIVAVEIEMVELDRWDGVDIDSASAFLTNAEHERCRQQADPSPSIAARWAVKTATLRALGLAHEGLTDPDSRIGREVEVTHEPDGRPLVRLSGRAREAADAANLTSVHVSLTHGRDRVGALVVLES